MGGGTEWGGGHRMGAQNGRGDKMGGGTEWEGGDRMGGGTEWGGGGTKWGGAQNGGGPIQAVLQAAQQAAMGEGVGGAQNGRGGGAQNGRGGTEWGRGTEWRGRHRM